MELNALQRFEQARNLAQQKMIPKAPTQGSSLGDRFAQLLGGKNTATPSSPTSIQDLIRSKQQELGMARKSAEPTPTSISNSTLTYGRSGKVQSTFANTATTQRPLGNYLDMVG